MMIDYTLIPQENKAEILERAVINGSVDDVVNTVKDFGIIEFTARALGTSCRFRGVEIVKALVENGATFDIPKEESVEKHYHCYSGLKDENYRTNFSLCLLKIFKHIKGACCFKGVKLVKQAVCEDKRSLSFLADEERVKVLNYLYETREKTDFDPEEMLFYAYFAQDDVIISELKRLGVTLSETRLKYITNGGPATNGYWYEWCAMIGSLTKENFVSIIERIRGELSGKFHFTEWVYHRCEESFFDLPIFEFFLDNFKQEKMNKAKIIRDAIDKNAIGVLPIIEKAGWLNNPRKRDEMIKYASDSGKTECTAWLMDFKNRTADFAAEREKAEKKMRREMNAGPNSVTALKQIWSFYRKPNVEGLVITNYKGSSIEVTVPEMIGKTAVTVIGNGAFATVSGRGGVVFTNATGEQLANRCKITKITLPKTLKKIDTGAFDRAISLREIEIPDGVEEIGALAFYECSSLTRIVIPESVKKIGEYAFKWCKSLKEVIIHDGVEEIGKNAFCNCENLTIIAAEGSYAEQYCKENNIPYICK